MTGSTQTSTIPSQTMSSGMTMKAFTSEATEAPKANPIKTSEFKGGASRGRGKANKFGGARMKVRVKNGRGSKINNFKIDH